MRARVVLTLVTAHALLVFVNFVSAAGISSALPERHAQQVPAAANDAQAGPVNAARLKLPLVADALLQASTNRAADAPTGLASAVAPGSAPVPAVAVQSGTAGGAVAPVVNGARAAAHGSRAATDSAHAGGANAAVAAQSHTTASGAVPGTAAVAVALGPSACDMGGTCAALGEAVVSAAEGPGCRMLHLTGKCTPKCLAALKDALSNKLWDACATRCQTDVVSGAAQRWAEMCEARQPTLFDQATEKIVATAPGAGGLFKALAIVVLLGAAVALGYRRGILQGHATRLQQRIKKQSERNIV